MSNPLVIKIVKLLNDAGISGILQNESYFPKHFGDGEVVFSVGSLLLRFISDRSQLFLDIRLTTKESWVYIDKVFEHLNQSGSYNLNTSTCPNNIDLAIIQIKNRYTDIEQLLENLIVKAN